MRIIKKIKADVARYNTFDPIPAKQSDAESRFLEVTLTNDGEALTVPADSTVTINARRSDGESKSFEGSVTDDGAVLVPLTSWMLELDDIVQCDISVISGTEKLTVMSFSVRVQRASCDGNDISSSENYDILISLIAQVKELVSESGMTTLGISGAKKGQGAIIKSVDENGVPQEWEAGDSKPFVVTVTYGADDTLTADKTHAEIVAAYAAGAQINAKIVNYPGVMVPCILPLYANMSDEMLMFGGSGVRNFRATAMTAIDTNGSWRVELTGLATLDDIPSGVFTINLVADSGGNITADKTFSEIKAASDEGKVVNAKFDDLIVPLCSLIDSEAVFALTNANSFKVLIASLVCTSDNVWSMSQNGFDAHTLGISGASVGQIVKIKTVDSSGVPTEWEPADMPSGGGGTDTSLGLTGATVGQIVKIKTVDASGAPTEWEAVDAKPLKLVGEYTLPENALRFDVENLDISANAISIILGGITSNPGAALTIYLNGVKWAIFGGGMGNNTKIWLWKQDDTWYLKARMSNSTIHNGNFATGSVVSPITSIGITSHYAENNSNADITQGYYFNSGTKMRIYEGIMPNVDY